MVLGTGAGSVVREEALMELVQMSGRCGGVRRAGEVRPRREVWVHREVASAKAFPQGSLLLV